MAVLVGHPLAGIDSLHKATLPYVEDLLSTLDSIRIWLVGPRNHSIHLPRSQKNAPKYYIATESKTEDVDMLFRTCSFLDTSKPTNLELSILLKANTWSCIPSSKAHYWWSTTSLWDGLAVLWKSYVQWMSFRVAWWKNFRMKLDSFLHFFVTCTWTPFPFLHKNDWCCGCMLWVYVMGYVDFRWGRVRMLVKTSLR